MSKELSRRVFLRASAYGFLFPILAKDQFQSREKYPIEPIKTLHADYYQITENHTKPLPVADLKKLPDLDLFFYESMRKAEDFSSLDFDTLNHSQNIYLNQLADDHRVTSDQAAYFKTVGTQVCFEGYQIRNKDFGQSDLATSTEGLLGVLGGIGYLAARLKEMQKGGAMHLKLLDVIAATIGMWLSTPMVTSIFGSVITVDTKVDRGDLETMWSTFEGMVNNLHPENKKIFFRNMMMVRKLQFLGQAFHADKGRRVNIAYTVGEAHAGMKNILESGEELVLKVLDMTDAQFVEELATQNGGLDYLVTNYVFDPSSKTRHAYKDEKLEQIFAQKLTSYQHPLIGMV